MLAKSFEETPIMTTFNTRKSLQHVLVVTLLSSIVSSLAHVGHLHDYPESDPVAQKWPRTKVGSCASWKKVTEQKASLLMAGRRLQAAAATNTTSANMTILQDPSTLSAKGSAELWVYLMNNCSGAIMSGIRANLTISSAGKGVGNIPIDGFVQTGSCASGGGSIFLFNSSMPSEDENQVLISRKKTSNITDGTIIGTAGVEGLVTTGGVLGGKSLVLYYNGTAFSCCDMDIEDPGKNYSAPLAKKGKACDMADGDHTMHDDAATNGTTKTVNGTSGPSADQIGMSMNGVWMACTDKVDGQYVMTHDGLTAVCTEYKNGTRVSLSATTTGNSTGNSSSNSTHKHSGAGSVRAGGVGVVAAAVMVGMVLMV